MGRVEETNMTDKIRLIFIIGPTRAGSTLLDRLLGQIPGFWSIGEMLPHLDRFISGLTPCGCGRMASECEFWSDVINEFARKWSLDNVKEFVRDFQPSAVRGRIRIHSLPDRERQAQEEKHAIMIASLYSIIRHIVGADVLVDSSESPWFVNFLSRIPALHLYVIHLTRDPRAVTYSWSRRKKEIRPTEYMQTRPAIRVAMHWLRYNWRAEAIKAQLGNRATFIRYEDLASDPQKTLTKLLMAYDPQHVPELSRVISGNSAVVGVNHTAGGNPDRVKVGRITIRPDVEWRCALPVWKQLFVTSLTWPLMFKYGYLAPQYFGQEGSEKKLKALF